MSEPKISVVLGTYNQKDVIKRVLEGYENQTLNNADFEVVVVDSMSDDGTAEALTSYNPNYNFNYIRKENNGKAYARNFGVSQAKSELIIITDADMIPDEKFVETHFNAHQDTQGPACFEGLTYNLDHYHWPPKSDSIEPYISRDYPQGKKLGWFYFLTGNISFPKSLFEEEKGFSEAFKGYGWEDLELGYRLSKKSIPL